MANTIKIKQSSTASAVPTAGDLVTGELAINVTDKKLYSKDATTVFEIANNATATGNFGEIDQAETVTGLWNFIDVGTGKLTAYDIAIGDTSTPDYGIARIGDSIIGRTSHTATDGAPTYNLNGAFIFQNPSGPVTGDIEFGFLDSAGLLRFGLPKSAVGNATYNPRSMIIAGPAIADSDVVTLGYWQGQGIFDNLTMDTATNGADLGVQNDLEVEGDIFVDSILESTTAAGVTIDGVLIKDGLVDGVDVTTLSIQETPYTFSNSTGISDPGAGTFKFNNTAYTTASVMSINDADADGNDAAFFLSAVAIDDLITLRSATDPANDWIRMKVTAVTDNTGWWQINFDEITYGSFFSNTDLVTFTLEKASDLGDSVTMDSYIQNSIQRATTDAQSISSYSNFTLPNSTTMQIGSDAQAADIKLNATATIASGIRTETITGTDTDIITREATTNQLTLGNTFMTLLLRGGGTPAVKTEGTFDFLNGGSSDGARYNSGSASHLIGAQGTVTNVEYYSFSGHFWLRDGLTLKISDSLDTDFAEFSHDGVDFNTALTNTTDWNITGLTGALRAGNYSFNVSETVGAGQDNYVLTYDNGTGLIGLEAAAGGGNVSNTGTPLNNQVAIWTDATTIEGVNALTFDGTTLAMPDFQVSAAQTSLLRTGIANTAGSGNRQTDLHIQAQAGEDFYLGINYGGTTGPYLDNRTTGPFTWRVTGTEYMSLASTLLKVSTDVLISNGGVAPTNQRQLSVVDDNQVVADFESTNTTSTLVDLVGDAANTTGAFLRFYRGTSLKGVIGHDQATTTSAITIKDTHTGTRYHSFYTEGSGYYLRQGGRLRIYNSGDTDYADFSHDGTDFNLVFTNTDDWNIVGARNVALDGTTGFSYNEGKSEYWATSMDNSASDTTTWYKIAQISLPSGTFRSEGFFIKVIDHGNNYGASPENQNTYEFRGNYERSAAVDGDVDASTLVGVATGFIRLVRTALGEAELQFKAETTNRGYTVEILRDSSAGGGTNYVTWFDLEDATAGSTTGTIVTPSTTSTGGGRHHVLDTAVHGEFRVYDDAKTDHVTFSHDGTNFNTTFANTSSWSISLPITGVNFQDAGQNVFRIDNANNRIEIRDAWSLRMHDATDTDYAEFSHDGTDFNTTFFGTTDWNITNLAGGIKFADSVNLKFGTGSDFLLYHDGTNNYIDSVGATAELRIRANSTESSIICKPNGVVELYTDNQKSLETTVNGIKITGKTTDSHMEIYNSSGGKTVNVGWNSTTGVTFDSYVNAATVSIRGETGSGTMNSLITAVPGSDVNLYFNNVIVAETRAATSGGLVVNNTLTGTGSERVLTESDKVRTVVKLADESVTSSTTYQDDNHMASISLEANRWYRVEFHFDTNGATGGLKFQWIFSQTLQDAGSMWGEWWTWLSAGSGANHFGGVMTSPITGITLSNSANNVVNGVGHFKTNATTGGTLKLQWAQQTSSGTATVLGAGSHMTIQKMN